MADRRSLGRMFTRVLVAVTVALSTAPGATISASHAAAPLPAAQAAPVGALLVPAHGAYWGAWAANGSASAVASFENAIGRRLDIVHQYHAWNDVWPTSTEYTWAGGGRIIFGNISARTTSSGVLAWSYIATSSANPAIDAMASRFKAFGRLLFVSFDQEPESRLGLAGFAASDYINASRHLHDRFLQDGVRNVVWVWNVAGSTSSSDLLKYRSLYPGDGYVDWVAWDPYNWNTCIHPYGWRTFDQIVAPFYNWLAAGHLSAGSAGKPYMLAEYGSVEGAAGAKGQWFVGESSTAAGRPRLKAVVYFNENKDCNWPITTSSSSVAGFRTASRSCWFFRAAPSPPTSVTATAGAGSAQVGWHASTSVCPITSYSVVVSPGGRRVNVSGGTRSVSIGSLASGTSYTFQVRATSMNGTSAWSAASPAVVPTGAVRSTPGTTPGATPRPSAAASAPATASGTPTVAGNPVGAVRSDPFTAWLESHLYVVPLGVVLLLAFGLGTQAVGRRRRKRQG